MPTKLHLEQTYPYGTYTYKIHQSLLYKSIGYQLYPWLAFSTIVQKSWIVKVIDNIYDHDLLTRISQE